MAEEVVIIHIAVGDKGLEVHINSDDYMMLWGLARLIEKRADDVQMRAMSAVTSKKPRLVVLK